MCGWAPPAHHTRAPCTKGGLCFPGVVPRFLEPPKPFTFLTFHAGPRMCLGMDMTYIQVKVGCAFSALCVSCLRRGLNFLVGRVHVAVR